MKITINEHSSIRVECGKIIYFDPFRITSDTHDADIIFVTHSHYDHLSPEDIDKIKKSDTIFIAPEETAAQIKDIGVKEKNVISVHPSESTQVLGISFETVHAYNENKKFHPKSIGWVGDIVDIDDNKIYVAGDTDAIGELKNINCDIALVPVGGTFTMTAIEAAELINNIKPKIAIPTHYGSIVGKKSDGDEFKKYVDSKIKVEILIG